MKRLLRHRTPLLVFASVFIGATQSSQAQAQNSVTVATSKLRPHQSASNKIAASLDGAEARLHQLSENLKRLQQREAKVATLEDALSKVTLQKSRLEQALILEQRALKKANALQFQLSDARRTEAAYREETERLRRESVENRQSLAIAEATLNGVTRLKSKIESEWVTFRHESTARHEALEASLAELKQYQAQLQGEKQAGQEALQAMTVERNAARNLAEKHRSSEQKVVQSLADARQQWLATEKELSGKVARAAAAHDTLTTENGRLREELGSVNETLTDTNQRFEEQAAALSQSRIDLAASQEKLRATEDSLKGVETARGKLIEDHQELAQMLEAAQEDTDSWKRQFAELEKRLVIAENGSEESKQLQEALKRLREQERKDRQVLTQLQSETKSLRLSKEKLEGQLHDSTAQQKQIKALESQLIIHRDEAATLQTTLKDEQKGWDELRATLQSTQEHLQHELTAAQIEQDALLHHFLQIEPIRYELNSTRVDSTQARILAQVKKILSLYPEAVFEISGHTCTIGSERDNKALSERRAQRLRDFLTANGVPEQHLQANGYGQNAPIAPNDTDAGRRQNRRVEVRVTSANGGSLLHPEE